MFVFSSLFVLSKFNNFVCISLFELILPMFATRKPRRTSSPFKVILTEEKDIICFHCRKNKILAAKLQMFFDFAIEIRNFCSVKRENLSDKTPSRGFQSLFGGTLLPLLYRIAQKNRQSYDAIGLPILVW